MALKPCKECKKEISDRAEKCPYCGVEYPGDYGNGTLIIYRRNTLPGMLGDIHISIDGTEVGKLKVDQSLKRELSSGTYNLQCWQSSWFKSQPLKVKIWGGYISKVDVYIKLGFSSAPVMEFAQD